MNGESTETYYAEMEAARNDAEDAYFNARPQLADTIYARTLFREGFERGFRIAWERMRDAAHVRMTCKATCCVTGTVTRAENLRRGAGSHGA